MSKRFTETGKWKDAWFRRLKPTQKLFFLMLLDECDAAGFWEPDEELASFLVGASIDLQSSLEALQGRVEVMPSGYWRLTKFVAFQYGTLSAANPCHRGVLRLVEQRSIEGATKGLASPTGIGIGKEKGKGVGEGGVGETTETYHPDSRAALHWLNEKAGRHYRETDDNLATISARLREPDVTIDGVKTMIDRMVVKWKSNPDMESYLRPATLFGKQKFDGYYGAKDAPILQFNENPQSNPASNARNAVMSQGSNDIRADEVLRRRAERARLEREAEQRPAVVESVAGEMVTAGGYTQFSPGSL